MECASPGWVVRIIFTVSKVKTDFYFQSKTNSPQDGHTASISNSFHNKKRSGDERRNSGMWREFSRSGSEQ